MLKEPRDKKGGTRKKCHFSKAVVATVEEVLKFLEIIRFDTILWWQFLNYHLFKGNKIS